MEASAVAVNGAARLHLVDADQAERAAVSVVQAAALASVWPKVAHWIVAALEKTAAYELTPGMVYARLELGESFLLVVHRPDGYLLGACVLDKRCDRRGLAWLNVAALGGDGAPEWLHLMVEAIKRICRESGHARVVILGRPGWAKWLHPHGVRRKSVVMTWDCESEADHGR